ncbi:MAG: Fic/DOC family N-terminal domain-containing protein [Halioglobus sp.]
MKPYIPETLPLANLDYAGLIEVVGEANRSLVRYDGLLHGIPSPAVLLSPLTAQEAVMSSKIEGTQVTLGEVLEFEAGGDLGGQRKADDAQEIMNYRQALGMATASLADRPITLGFIKEMHAILMDSVRGQDKTPGQFRTEQNWIGTPGCKIDEATFVPPEPIRLLENLESWEKYIHTPDRDPLIQTAIIHAQFELIHPFNDGNGRIGRLLVPLYLYSKQVLVSPTFYLSGYLEENRDEYIGRLGAISGKGDWQGWIKFFLEAIVHQAKRNSEQVTEILKLYETMKTAVQQITRSQFSAAMVDGLFSLPVFNTKSLEQTTGIPKQTLLLMVRQLRDANILLTLREGAGRRSAIHAFPELINITEGREVFAKISDSEK